MLEHRSNRWTPLAACAVVTLAFAFFVASESRAAILEVDCANGPFFTIAAAIDAAATGDTVLVRECASGPYEAFVVDGKERVHIIGHALPSRGAVPAPDFRPPVVVTANLPEFVCARIVSSTGVSVRGFTFEDCPFQSIAVSGSTDTRVIGNRFERGGEETIRDGGSGTQYIENVVTQSGFSFFLDGDDALVARNLIFDNQLGAIEVTGDRNYIVDNRSGRNGGECVGDQGDETRIEGNVCRGNLRTAGLAEISLRPGSTNPDVIGNVTGGNISDLSATGADLADNL